MMLVTVSRGIRFCCDLLHHVFNLPGTTLFISLLGAFSAFPVEAQTLDRWVLRHPLPTLERLHAVNFVNDQFFSFGSDSILRSEDGTNWVTVASGSGGPIFQAAYGNGRIVAVGDGSRSTQTGYESVAVLAVSNDGRTWAALPNRKVPPCTSVAFGQGLFVAISRSAGTNTSIWTSPDGEEWTNRAVPGPGHLVSVAYADGNFVAVGGETQMVGSHWQDRREAYASSDGVHWVSLVQSDERQLYTVTPGAGGFLAQSGITSPVFFKGGTNQTWETLTASSSPGGAAAFGDGVFKIVVSGPAVAASADGVTWTTPSLLVGLGPEEGGPDFGGLAFGKGVWVGVGSAGLIGVSSDAIHWSFPQRATTLSLSDLCEGNGLLVAVGGEAYDPGVKTNSAVAITSPDGLNWTKQTVPATQRLASVVFGAGRFVAVGGDARTDSGATLVVSTNGTDWISAPLAETTRFTRVLYGNDLFVAMGRNRLISSSDGLTWTTRLNADGQTLTDLAWGAGRFVLSTLGQDRWHVLYSSTNLVNWDGPFPPGGLVEDGLVYGNGVFRVPGRGPGLEGTGVFVSADGQQWSLLPTNELQPSTLTPIPTGFVGVRNQTNILSSTDGVHWRVQSRAVVPLNGLAYVRKSVFALGDEAAIFQSAPPNPSFPLAGMIWLPTGGLELTVDSAVGDRIEIDFSPDFRNWSLLGSATNLDGCVHFQDSPSARPNHGFYRARALRP